MAVSYIASAYNGATITNSVVVTHGMTILEDDAIIALCHMNNTGVTVNSPPSGFSVVWSGDLAGSSHSYSILKKDASASEGATYTFGISETTRLSVVLLQVRGAALLESDVAPTTGGEESGSSSTECPTITVADNSIAIGWHLRDSNAIESGVSVDNSYTLAQGNTSSSQTQESAYRLFTTGAATGETKITVTGTNTHTGYSFSFKEVAGGGGIIPQAMHNYRQQQ